MAEEKNKNPLIELHERYGQSPWLDSIDRSLIVSGQLQDWVALRGLRGLTSNPSIFEKAMTESDAYDEQISALLEEGDVEVKTLYEDLAILDIQSAADVLRPVYNRSQFQDGFASLEVSPALARDAGRTIDEARRLWTRLDRPNVLIKVPGTEEGVPAIRALVAEGINVNITLLFSRAMYRRVAYAHLEALEERALAGKPIDRVASVASFFVSRIDTQVDQRLLGPQGQELRGRVAIANAKLAYAFYRELIESDRWKALAAKGAHPQRLLWASTSTKNALYSDVLYVDELIGRDTVNTMPPATMRAFEQHGSLRESLTENLDEARQTLQRLPELGISLDEITTRLTDEGIRLFLEPFDSLMASLQRKKRRLLRDGLNPLSLRFSILDTTKVGDILKEWRAQGKVRRLWNRDASLWTGKDEAHWLGWLDAVDAATEHLESWKRCRATLMTSGASEIVLLGMGGSSLAPEVFLRTFDAPLDRPELHVLDSTDPEQIAALERKINFSRAFFIVSSKSGTTLEPNIFLDYFYSRVTSVLGDGRAGMRFIAITDPGSPLERAARARGFLAVFHGNPEIGGRYSALSAFGLVPAALMGVEIGLLLDRAKAMVHSCSESVPAEENPGVILGAALGALGKSGRDKVTFVCSPEIGDLSSWLEQLLAESTGKNGKGLIPVSEEELGPADSYGNDRVFVYLKLCGTQFGELDSKVAALEEYGHPIIRIEVENAYALGQEFFRWELATAVAGSVLGLNPFDQPDVEASKVETRKLTSEIEKTGALPAESPVLLENGIAVYADAGLPVPRGSTLVSLLRAHFGRLRRGDYAAILAYLERSSRDEELLQEIRGLVRSSFRVATCLGFGPRFLHSTGQAYKGGPNTGVFLQITSEHSRDLLIPGKAFSFGQVEAAQARGDLEVLASRGRRWLRVHLPADRTAGLRRLRDALVVALRAGSEEEAA